MRSIAAIGLSLIAIAPAFGQAPEPPKLSAPVPDLVQALIASLADVDLEVRVYAANALAAIGTPAVDPLMAALLSANRDVRSSAAYSLGQMGADAAPAAAPLIKLLRDVDTDVRRQSAQAIGRILLSQRLPTLPVQQPPTPPVQPPPPVFPPVP